MTIDDIAQQINIYLVGKSTVVNVCPFSIVLDDGRILREESDEIVQFFTPSFTGTVKHRDLGCMVDTAVFSEYQLSIFDDLVETADIILVPQIIIIALFNMQIYDKYQSIYCVYRDEVFDFSNVVLTKILR